MQQQHTDNDRKDVKAAHSLFVRAASRSAAVQSSDGLSNIGFDGKALSGSGCPVVGSQGTSGAPQAMPDGHPALPTERVVSSIPCGAEDLPPHQNSGGQGQWVYPSEQMFFQAMKRKGWPAAENDMKSIVQIHNGVNERAWNQILRYEALHTGCFPKLKKFMGRPQDYSPKARLLNFLGYKLPFDRHDWIVDRCGQEVRYVIDFYNAAPLPDMPVAMHLDARPAIDSIGALYDRLRLQFRWMSEGSWRRG